MPKIDAKISSPLEVIKHLDENELSEEEFNYYMSHLRSRGCDVGFSYSDEQRKEAKEISI